MKLRAIIGLLALALLAIAPAQAQNCSLKLLTSVNIQSESGRPMVPVTINGSQKLMLLDTGGFVSQLTRDTVKALDMTLRDSRMEIYDASGHVSNNFVFADTFTLGTLSAKHLPLQVTPLTSLGADGLLSSDLMFLYDVEMDFGANKLNYFSPNHCPGKVVYWPGDVAEVPLTLRDYSHVFVETRLDGKTFEALIDTGATRSIISMLTARTVFGLEPGSPGVTPAGNVNDDPKLASYRHTFSSLTFEGVNVNNPTFLIMPDRMGGSATQTGTHIAGNPDIKLPSLVLGMDILRHLRMYMSVKEKKMYVSAANLSPAPAQGAAAP